eukprot:269300-Pelagomonas_calceolata.AAC.1
MALPSALLLEEWFWQAPRAKDLGRLGDHAYRHDVCPRCAHSVLKAHSHSCAHTHIHTHKHSEHGGT